MLSTVQKASTFLPHLPYGIYQRNLNLLFLTDNSIKDKQSLLLNLTCQSSSWRRNLNANSNSSQKHGKTETLSTLVLNRMMTTNLSEKRMIKKVAVVGCGAAGLCVLRHLTIPNEDLSDTVNFEAVGFEQAPQIGGTWVYSPSTGYDPYGLPVHTSIYKNLRWVIFF